MRCGYPPKFDGCRGLHPTALSSQCLRANGTMKDSRSMADPDKKKARKRAKKRKRRELERAVEENGHHAREKKRKGKR